MPPRATPVRGETAQLSANDTANETLNATINTIGPGTQNETQLLGLEDDRLSDGTGQMDGEQASERMARRFTNERSLLNWMDGTWAAKGDPDIEKLQ